MLEVGRAPEVEQEHLCGRPELATAMTRTTEAQFYLLNPPADHHRRLELRHAVRSPSGCGARCEWDGVVAGPGVPQPALPIDE